jgi:hypothetical protein
MEDAAKGTVVGALIHWNHWLCLEVIMKLQLALKSEYFDAIQSGEKTEEYRLANDYWRKRLVGRDYDSIILTKGYPRRNDKSRRMEFRFQRPTIKTITHPHFGLDPVEVFAIPVGHEIPSDLDMELHKAGMLGEA